MDFDLLKRIIEAALLAAPQPLTLAQLTDLFGEGEAPPADDLRRALHALQEDSAARGVELIEVASGFRYQVRADVYPHIARLWAEKPPRYSRALLETLALIAYRQPITRGEIEAIRGVAVNSQIVRTLEEREWIRVVGHRDVPGKPALFGTTRAFLDYFNLKSLDQLPPLAALQELPDLEPELDFDGARARAALPAAGETETGAEAATQPEGNEATADSLPAETAQAPEACEVEASRVEACPSEASTDTIALIGADSTPKAEVTHPNNAALEDSELADPNSIDGAQHADAFENDLDTATRHDEERAVTDTPETTDPTGESKTLPEQIP